VAGGGDAREAQDSGPAAKAEPETGHGGTGTVTGASPGPLAVGSLQPASSNIGVIIKTEAPSTSNTPRLLGQGVPAPARRSSASPPPTEAPVSGAPHPLATKAVADAVRVGACVIPEARLASGCRPWIPGTKHLYASRPNKASRRGPRAFPIWNVSLEGMRPLQAMFHEADLVADSAFYVAADQWPSTEGAGPPKLLRVFGAFADAESFVAQMLWDAPVRCFYEVVRQGRPCKAYLDLEAEEGACSAEEGARLLDATLALWSALVEKLWPQSVRECPRSREAVVLDGSRRTAGGWKVSYHVVYPWLAFPCNEGLLPGVVVQLRRLEALQYTSPGGVRRPFVSAVHYTPNRAFRTAMSWKLSDETCTPMRIRGGDTLSNFLLACVTCIEPDAWHVPPAESHKAATAAAAAAVAAAAAAAAAASAASAGPGGAAGAVVPAARIAKPAVPAGARTVPAHTASSVGPTGPASIGGDSGGGGGGLAAARIVAGAARLAGRGTKRRADDARGALGAVGRWSDEDETGPPELASGTGEGPWEARPAGLGLRAASLGREAERIQGRVQRILSGKKGHNFGFIDIDGGGGSIFFHSGGRVLLPPRPTQPRARVDAWGGLGPGPRGGGCASKAESVGRGGRRRNVRGVRGPRLLLRGMPSLGLRRVPRDSRAAGGVGCGGRRSTGR
jgi:hypothetical protein